MTNEEIAQRLNNVNKSINDFSKAINHFKLSTENIYTTFLNKSIPHFFPYANIEIKFVKGIVKLISDIELLDINLATCGSMLGLPHLSL